MKSTRIPLLKKYYSRVSQQADEMLQKQMEDFNGISFEKDLTPDLHKEVSNIEKHLTTFESKVFVIGEIYTVIFFILFALFAAVMPFQLAYWLNINQPIKTSLYYFIPSTILSLVILARLLRIYDTISPPLEVNIEESLKALLFSAAIVAISINYFSPLVSYLIITPIIVGVGSSAGSLSLGVLLQIIFEQIRVNSLYKKHPRWVLIDLLISLMGYFYDFRESLEGRSAIRFEFVNLLGNAANIMQKYLPYHFTRRQNRNFAVEINDPYITKLLENHVNEMAMTLRVYARKITFDKNSLTHIEQQLAKNLYVLITEEWNRYEIEKVEVKPTPSRLEIWTNTLKSLFIAFIPLLAMSAIQKSKYAVPDSTTNYLLPFVTTWAIVSVLNLLDSTLVDKVNRTKSMSDFLHKK